uniref:Uncharacterized protein n=1 Tax=Plectus sambesii TaxID=2011161 RepID=A0A914WUC7_9BILA
MIEWARRCRWAIDDDDDDDDDSDDDENDNKSDKGGVGASNLSDGRVSAHCGHINSINIDFSVYTQARWNARKGNDLGNDKGRNEEKWTIRIRRAALMMGDDQKENRGVEGEDSRTATG